VQPPHPAGLMDHLDHEVQQLHLAAATRCNQRTGGVQPTRPRGAAVAPEPSTEPSLKPSAAPGPTRTRAAAVGGRGGRPTSSSPPSRTPGCSPASSEPGSAPPSRPR
jgi:hypothetical protein